MKRYLSWSGGKDSTASIIICYENGIHLDGIIMSEVMFDHSRNISGEDPVHIEWVKKIAIPTIEEKFNFNVIFVRSEQDYISNFYRKIYKSKIEQRNGKFAGWFISGKCKGNSVLKMKPLNDFFCNVGDDVEEIVGIAKDEEERYKKMKNRGIKKRSVLYEFGISQREAEIICKKHNLLSPIYSYGKRNGCWFCPNNKIEYFARIKKDYPYLWEELQKFSKEQNVVCENFNYTHTFNEIENLVDFYNSQLNMFD